MFDPSHGPAAEANDRLEDRVARLETQVAELRSAIGLAAANGVGGTEESPDGRTREETSPPAAEEASQPQTNSSAPRSASPSIERWFEERGFGVELAEEDPVDQVFDRIAEYLGDHFSDLERLFRGLLWSQREGRSSHLTPQDHERNHCLELCRILHDRALLSNFHFNRNNGNLTFKANGDQRFQQFLEGYWLERYVLGKARKQVEEKTSAFSVARNLELKGPTGKFEMDVFLLVEGEPIWIECKSRNYQQHIERYVQRAKVLEIPIERTMLVVQSFETRDAEGVAEDLRLMYGLSVTPTSQFPAQLAKMLEGILTTDDGEDALASKLAKCLAEGQMNPHPEARHEILSTLAGLPAENLPATVRDIREWVKERVPEEMETFVHPVLMAVRRGGGMVGGNGRPYTAMGLDAKIAELAARDAEKLETLCRAAYEETIRRKLPALTELPEFATAFEGLVDGGSVVSAA